MILAGLLLTAALASSCAKIRTLPDTTPQEIAMKTPVMTKAAGEWITDLDDDPETNDAFNVPPVNQTV